MDIQVREQISELYEFPLTKDTDVKHGGRMIFKTSSNAASIIFTMLQHKDCETVVVRKHKATHRDSTFKALINAFERMGMVQGYHYTINNSTPWIRLYNGSKIYFIGVDDTGKVKGAEPSPNKFIGILWFFEADEISTREKFEQTISTYVRGTKPFFHRYVEFNVCEGWIEEWLNDNRDNSHITYANIEMVCDYEKENWIGEHALKSIEELKENNFALYEYIYLAKPLGNKRIFNFQDFTVNEDKELHFMDMFAVIDPKSTGEDYFACSIFGLTRFNKMVFVDTIFRNTKLDKQLIYDVSNLIKKWNCRTVWIETNKEYTLAVRLSEILGSQYKINSFHTSSNKQRKILDNALDIRNIQLVNNPSKDYDDFLDNLFYWQLDAKHDDAPDVMAIAAKVKRKDTNVW